MRRTRLSKPSHLGVVGAVFALAALLLAACGSSGDGTKSATTTTAAASAAANGTCAGFKGSGNITVGGTNFSEQEIVAEMYAQCLQAAGYNVSKKLKIGSREIVLPALEKGDIDVYPEYVGTLLTFLKGTPTSDAQKTLSDLQTALKDKNLQVLTPSAAEDKNGFAVTKATADKYKLTKISDLAPVASQLVFGAGPECDQRPLCLVGLRSTYGLTFKEVKKLDSGGPLTKDALEKGDIDVGLIFTSDGAVAARGFVVLQDDKNLQPPDNVVPIVRTAVLQGDLQKLLDSISAKMTTASLSALNKSVDIDKADPADVAKGWLQDNGFLKK